MYAHLRPRHFSVTFSVPALCAACSLNKSIFAAVLKEVLGIVFYTSIVPKLKNLVL